MRLPGPPEGPVFPSLPTYRPIGHPHFWDRVLSRRDVLAGAAGATGLLATSGVWAPVLARRASSDPKPIPGVVAPGAPFHVNLPGHGNEPSTITDFNGLVGLAEVRGEGNGWEPGAAHPRRLTFDVDVRFMAGEYVGQDGRMHHGSFAFT